MAGRQRRGRDDRQLGRGPAQRGKDPAGYEQSEKNFEIDPADGVTLHYYSRYGQSYGNPYGEWDVMFLSYCLKYAGIPQSASAGGQRASCAAP